MAKVYTQNIFLQYQYELHHNLISYLFSKELDDNIERYVVMCSRTDERIVACVKYNVVERKNMCSCKLLESEGILCKHLLFVLRLNESNILSQHYIIERWTIGVTKKSCFRWSWVELCDNCDGPSSSHNGELHSIFFRWVIKTYYSEAKFELAKNKLMEDVEEVVGYGETTQKSNFVIKMHLLEISKRKGSGKRWKSRKKNCHRTCSERKIMS